MKYQSPDIVWPIRYKIVTKGNGRALIYVNGTRRTQTPLDSEEEAFNVLVDWINTKRSQINMPL